MPTLEPWHWWVLGGILVVLEAMLPGFVLLWLGLAAFGTGGVLWLAPSMSLALQIITFAGLSLLCVLSWFGWLRFHPIDVQKPTLNRRAQRFVGHNYELVTPISNGRGRVRIGDSRWIVEGPDLPKGVMVKVVSVDGNVLRILPADDHDA